jgi:predicted amidohydrolase
VYLKARALENHAFVVLVNRVGTEENVRFFGGSGVCDPFGRVSYRAGEEETLLIADLDPSLIEESRRSFDYLADRRPAFYGPLARADGPAS